MTIGLILHPYGEKEQSGLGRAAFELSRAAIAAAPRHRFIVCAKNAAAQPPFSGSNWEFFPGKGGALWLDTAVRTHADVDVWIFFTPRMPLFARPERSVVIAHDFAYLSLGERLGLRGRALKFLHARALKKASAIVAVSNYTKQEIVRHFPIAPQKISVIYDGINDLCNGGEQPVELPELFFLFAGVFKERKNVLNIVRGFARAVGKGFPGKLVLAGKRSGAYAQRVEKEIANLSLGERIILPGFISDAQLCYACRRALAFVYPTRIEGFGMAALDAMACGAPAILSKGGALEEAAGNAAIFVDPNKPEEIGEAMLDVWRDGSLREDLIKKGEQRAREFSWERSGRELISLLEKL